MFATRGVNIRSLTKTGSASEIIELRSIPEPNSGCWLWLGAAWEDRPNVYYQGKKRLASRVSYEAYVGPIPPGLHALHRCDNPWCVNPEHLFPGTQADNNQDMMNKGRHASDGWRLTKEERASLLAECLLFSAAVLSARYRGVTTATIQYYRRKTRSAHA